MSDEELIVALERECKRVGMRPILEILVDWIGRGFFLEIYEQVQDEHPGERGSSDVSVLCSGS